VPAAAAIPRGGRWSKEGEGVERPPGRGGNWKAGAAARVVVQVAKVRI